MTKLIYLLIPFFTTLSAISQNTSSPQPAFEFLTKYPHVRDFTLSQNQNEAYFTIQSPFEELETIACMKRTKGKWSEPALVNFTGKYRDIEPFLTTDGLRLYFSSNRPLSDSIKKEKDYDIWYVERKNAISEWGKPVNLGKTINSSNNEFYPSLTANKNLYFTSDAQTAVSKDDIYYSHWDGKNYCSPVALDSNINSKGFEFNAYVSSDETFIIYTIYGSKDGLGSGDLYVSFKDKNGNWQKSTNLGKDINSKYMDYCPYYDVSSQTLYFTSRRSIYETKYYNSINDFEKAINKYENGFSRIYKVSLKSIIPKAK